MCIITVNNANSDDNYLNNAKCSEKVLILKSIDWLDQDKAKSLENHLRMEITIGI